MITVALCILKDEESHEPNGERDEDCASKCDFHCVIGCMLGESTEPTCRIEIQQS